MNTPTPNTPPTDIDGLIEIAQRQKGGPIRASDTKPLWHVMADALSTLRDERDALKHDIGQYVKANADLHEDKDKAEARAEQAESENEGLHKLVDHYRAVAKAAEELHDWAGKVLPSDTDAQEDSEWAKFSAAVQAYRETRDG